MAIDNETAIASGSYFVWTSTLTGAAVAAEQMRLWNGKLGIGTQAPDCSVHVDSATGIKSAYTADSANAALVTLEKARITGTGASQNNDLLAQVNINAQDSTSTKTLVAQVEAKAIEAHTGTQRGTKLTVRTTTTAAAAVSDKVVIGDKVETLVTLKHTALEFDPAAVATTSTIAQLSATKALVEFSGGTATSLQGINSGAATKIITLHNGSSATVTLSHEDSGATALDRLKLPNSLSVDITAGNTAELFYSTVDTRWKLKSITTLAGVNARTTQTFYYPGSWTAPVGITRVLVQTTRYPVSLFSTPQGSSFFKDPEGIVYASGGNTIGEIADGSSVTKSTPVAVVGGLFFSQIKTNAHTTLGLDLNGKMYGWGQNPQGSLGDGTATAKSSPVAVVGGLFFSTISNPPGLPFGTAETTVALTKNGLAYAWGQNTVGQLGDGSTTIRSSPVAVVGGLKFMAVECGVGMQSMYGLTPAGVLYSWGRNSQGQLGDGSSVTGRSSPAVVVGGLTFASVRSSRDLGTGVFALTQAGACYSWGGNTNGQLGDGSSVSSKSSPVAVVGGLAFTKIEVSESTLGTTVTGLTSSGAAYSWGLGTKGTLGDGTSVTKSSPVAVVGGLAFSKIFAGNSAGSQEMAVFGITTAGALYGWGGNQNGQLGDGTTTARSSPVAVLGGLTWATMIADGGSSCYGVTTQGVIYAWGLNTNGQLGDGTVTPRSSPVAVIGAFPAACHETTLDNWLTVVPGQSYSIYTGYNPTFGNIVLGKDAVDVVTLQYG